MSSSSGTLLLLLPCVALGAVVQHGRNFIQVPANCKPPFALMNDRCVFVVQECSEDSGNPCQKTDYPSKSVLPRETVLHEDAITDENNNNELGERSFVGTIDCKEGYILIGRRCRQIFKRVGNRTDEGLTQQLDGDINSVDGQIEEIYNTQQKMDPAEREFAHRNIIGIQRKCRPGYRPDMKGRCRKIFNPPLDKPSGQSPSTRRFTVACRSGYLPDRNGICRKIFNPALDEPSGQSPSIRRFISACRSGYLPDRNGLCRKIFNPASEQATERPYFGRGLISVATSGCKSGYRLDSQGRCRKIYTSVSGNSLKDDSGEAESSKAFIQAPGCAAGAALINGVCRPVYTGKRNGEDYIDTNENTLMEANLRRRRRRSLRNQKHQGHLYSGSEE